MILAGQLVGKVGRRLVNIRKPSSLSEEGFCMGTHECSWSLVRPSDACCPNAVLGSLGILIWEWSNPAIALRSVFVSPDLLHIRRLD